MDRQQALIKTASSLFMGNYDCTDPQNGLTAEGIRELLPESHKGLAQVLLGHIPRATATHAAELGGQSRRL